MIKQRLKLLIFGTVQGVGFRPFIYRLATELNLTGWVYNSSSGVSIEVEGESKILKEFLSRIQTEKPPRSHIQSIKTTYLDYIGYTTFDIHHSVSGEKNAIIPADLATCPDCLRDIFDLQNRRYGYPFTNCTNCGPRYTIIETLPYDRPQTTMKEFSMCSECRQEYENPHDRRFHAQPNACPCCGPQLALWDKQGNSIAIQDSALKIAVNSIKEGKIIAVKGLGGFHLMTDGSNPDAIRQLRQRKVRPQKPFALMYPSLELIKHHCQVSPLEEELLTSPESPIVLLKRRSDCINLWESIAPNNPYWGVMLPYTPLHHLLLLNLKFPLVATSGNISDESICIDEGEVIERLGHIADVFLVHNRPILRPVDDSVVRVMAGREIVFRRARGYTPFPIILELESKRQNTEVEHSPPSISLLATGSQLKNTVAILRGNQVFISQHVGDLSKCQALSAFYQAIDSLKRLYDFEPEIIACDAHPDYFSSQFAQSQGFPVVKVQHHYAHVLSCIAENGITAPVLGVAWDGTGYGEDGTIWGGEFLLITDNSYQRVAHFRPFKLPGGHRAVKEPRRIALGILYEVFGSFDGLEIFPSFKDFSNQELKLIQQMLSHNLNAPLTSSVGRLFDGVASILGICQQTSFEGQGAMDLEYRAINYKTDKIYPYEILGDDFPLIVDWQLIIKGILDDLLVHSSIEEISSKFQNTLVEIIIEISQIISEKKVILTGGCFQNKYLTEQAISRLNQEQLIPVWHRKVPPNDGGIALGQIIAGIRRTLNQ
ncbi:hydrogenase maturation protein [cyanobacterium endosymbiont of Rhopalodia gibberula]|uniref:carbamoyltransferase HypF n=1 Tax=cyanobacterium endosymbiont of Rhopalodia gibberula TaxID=1763363 RepID=UPI000DC6F2E6|nr:carbamoyltransferase HypF [cyanobacterium endosymbiont of Rhopalodia gibberula]BBA79703.1 hydrogenase maturation protein [cyanobacterium endosymbiont of Rhopalodia gibberula]